MSKSNTFFNKHENEDSRGTSYQPCQPETQMETSMSDSGMYKLVCIYMPVTSIFNFEILHFSVYLA